MKTNALIAAIAVMLIPVGIFGQKIKSKAGSLKDLKGLTSLKIEYDYSSLGVGKYEVEQEYIDDKVADMNADEAGTGDTWKEAWFNDRPTRYEPKFEELFSKYAGFLDAGPDVNAEVVMQVHTTFIEPGFNVGVARKPAYIDLTVRFLRGTELVAELDVIKSPGTGGAGFDFDTGWRIAEAYAKAGKSLGKYLDKELN